MPDQADILEHMSVSEVNSGGAALSSADLAHFVDRLAAVDDTAADAELIDQHVFEYTVVISQKEALRAVILRFYGVAVGAFARSRNPFVTSFPVA